MGRHYHTVLTHTSPFIDQNCPVSRQTLQVGQAVVICTESQTAFQVESWKYLGEVCPFCTASGAVLPETQMAEQRPPVSAAWLAIPGQLPFPLDRDIVNLGRGPDSHLVLNDLYVSEQHARIRRAGKVFYLFDLASTNGTWVNDQRIYRLLLRDGDRIRLGSTILVFKQATEEKSFESGTQERKK